MRKRRRAVGRERERPRKKKHFFVFNCVKRVSWSLNCVPSKKKSRACIINFCLT